MVCVTDAQFNQTVGIEKHHIGELGQALILKRSQRVENFFDAIHPAALIALAEASAGHFLMSKLAVDLSSMTPNLRKIEAQIKRPAKADVLAESGIINGDEASFREELHRKSRASLSVRTEVRDIESRVICLLATSEWLIQMK